MFRPTGEQAQHGVSPVIWNIRRLQTAIEIPFSGGMEHVMFHLPTAAHS